MLAFLYDAFAAPDSIPESFHNLNVQPGQREQRIPWKDEMEDVYLFWKSVRAAFGLVSLIIKLVNTVVLLVSLGGSIVLRQAGKLIETSRLK